MGDMSAASTGNLKSQGNMSAIRMGDMSLRSQGDIFTHNLRLCTRSIQILEELLTNEMYRVQVSPGNHQYSHTRDCVPELEKPLKILQAALGSAREDGRANDIHAAVAFTRDKQGDLELEKIDRMLTTHLATQQKQLTEMESAIKQELSAMHVNIASMIATGHISKNSAWNDIDTVQHGRFPLTKVARSESAKISSPRHAPQSETDSAKAPWQDHQSGVDSENSLYEHHTKGHLKDLLHRKRKEIKPQAGVRNQLSLSEDLDVDDSGLELKPHDTVSHILGLGGTDLDHPPYHPDRHMKEGICKRVVMSEPFQNVTLIVIIANVVYLAVESQLNTASNLYDSDWVFFITDQFFCLFFLGELLLRYFAFATTRYALQDGWLRFDAFLVLSMIIEMWVVMPIVYFASSEESSVNIPTQPLRVIRLLKLARMARLLKAVPELAVMICGLAAALRAIVSTMLLVLVMMYAWSILVHSFMKGDSDFNNHLQNTSGYTFENIGDCMWTLLSTGTLMIGEPGLILTELLFSQDLFRIFTGISFLVYICLSALVVLQMLIGVLCDVVSKVAEERRNADSIGLMKQELLGDLMAKDNGDGKINRTELMSVFESDSSKALFKKLNINRLFLTSIAGLMFRSADAEVKIKAILELMILCRGDNPATVHTIGSALVYLADEIEHLHDNMSHNFEILQRGDQETSIEVRKSASSFSTYSHSASGGIEQELL